jgi:predicted TIM-barrel fold metal-dependent hydrolase
VARFGGELQRPLAEQYTPVAHLASAANACVVASLRQFVGPDKILFGTDFPPRRHILETAQAIRSLNMFSEAESRTYLFAGNQEELLNSFAGFDLARIEIPRGIRH